MFPYNVLDVIKTVLPVYFSIDDPSEPYHIVDRPLRFNDPKFGIGLFVTDWAPVAGHIESGQIEPVVNRYLYRAQIMVKATSESEGRTRSGQDAAALRAILYRDDQLQLGLRSLSSDVLGYHERFQRFEVMNQRFLNTELSGSFVFLSTTNFYVETETVAS